MKFVDNQDDYQDFWKDFTDSDFELSWDSQTELFQVVVVFGTLKKNTESYNATTLSGYMVFTAITFIPNPECKRCTFYHQPSNIGVEEPADERSRTLKTIATAGKNRFK